MKSKLSAPHPGNILLKEFIEPLKLSQYRLAKDIHVPSRRINEIVHGERSISVDTAIRLGRYFKMSAEFWLKLQIHYELQKQYDFLADRLEKEVKVLKRVNF